MQPWNNNPLHLGNFDRMVEWEYPIEMEVPWLAVVTAMAWLAVEMEEPWPAAALAAVLSESQVLHQNLSPNNICTSLGDCKASRYQSH